MEMKLLKDMDVFMSRHQQEDIKEKFIFLEPQKVVIFFLNFLDIIRVLVMIKMMIKLILKLLPLDKKEKSLELIAKDLLMLYFKLYLEM